MDQTNPASPEPEAGQHPRDKSSLDSLSQRLEGLARQLDEVADQPEEAANLVREASDLAAEAGREVEAALKAASEAREE